LIYSFLFLSRIYSDRVHVITRDRELEHLKALIEESKTYILYNCHVFDNNIAFKPVDHPFNVVFSYGRKVQKDDKLTNIPMSEQNVFNVGVSPNSQSILIGFGFVS